MSFFFSDTDGATLWNPGSGTGRMFVTALFLVADILHLSPGFTPDAAQMQEAPHGMQPRFPPYPTDDYTIDLDQLAIFVEAVARDQASDTHSEAFDALVRPVMLLSTALLVAGGRSTAAVPATIAAEAADLASRWPR